MSAISASHKPGLFFDRPNALKNIPEEKEEEEEEEEEKQREEKGEKARDIIHPLLCDMHLRQHSSTGPHLGHIWATPGIPNHGFSVHLKSNHGSNHGFQIVPGGKSST